MSDDEVGYGKPPKQHQFKKGQSGCPDGGAAIKRAKKHKAKLKGEKSPQQLVIEHFTKTKRVRINGKRQTLTMLQVAMMQLEDDVFVKRCPVARKLYFGIAERNGWFKAPPPKSGRSGVLVVNQIRPIDEWIKATEGELLPRNPLHGIPGAEDLLDDTPQERRQFLEED
jgi:hypothetical protein